ncbi:MAG: leucine-rich repeat domain-containing protein, partial [Eubacteriales bacterium]
MKYANQVVFLQNPPVDWKRITTKVYSKNLYYLDRYASDWETLDRTVWNDIGLNALTRGQINYIIIDCENLAKEGYTPTAPADLMEERLAEQFKEEGWSLTNEGVLTIRSNEGWLNWLHQDLGKRVEILEIGKDVTELTLYDMSETVPVDGFYRSSDISEYDQTGAPNYPYAITSYIKPSQIYLHPANKSFLYGDGILINLLTSEVVLADKNVPKDVMIPEGVRSIGNGAFKSRRIQTIQLPSTLETIGAQAFEQCSLTSLVIPNSVTSVGKFAFRECRYLKDVVLSDRLQMIETGVIYKCGLVQIVLPSGIQEIKADAFNQCSNLLLVKTSKSLRTIGPAAFENCEKLEEIWFSDQVESIGPRAFFDCKSLKQVVLPDKLKVIGAEVFGQCSLSLLRLSPELH